MKFRKIISILAVSFFCSSSPYAYAEELAPQEFCEADPVFSQYIAHFEALYLAAEVNGDTQENGICLADATFLARIEQQESQETELAMSNDGLSDDELGGLRGAVGLNLSLGGVQSSTANFGASLSGAKVDGVTGANTVAEGALNGVNGLTTLIQNSGSNVIMQSSTIVNITLQQ